MMWSFFDLSDDELRDYASGSCECITRERSGTRHGYVCPAHRAEKEIERRARVPRDLFPAASERSDRETTT